MRLFTLLLLCLSRIKIPHVCFSFFIFFLFSYNLFSDAFLPCHESRIPSGKKTFFFFFVFFEGGSPYPRMEGSKIANLLQQGYRMPKPEHVDDEL